MLHRRRRSSAGRLRGRAFILSRLPLVVSLPHAGLRVPVDVGPLCLLTREEIIRDGDEEAAAIYGPLKDEVAAFETTDVARAVIDLNRPEDDRRKDGIVKTHTCWDVPIWREPLPEDLVGSLIDRYHRPYHRRLTQLAKAADPILGLDCHTMAAQGPPVGPDPGSERPAICLGFADGTCPPEWIESLAACFRKAFDREVRVNDPFRGGWIIRSHAAELPWVQVEIARGGALTQAQKTERVQSALRRWCTSRAVGQRG